jgi:putative transcriptional regulator
LKPVHHLDDATIVSYAAGTLGEAHSVVAASHLAYCDTCRAAVRQAELIGGELLSASETKGVSDVCRAATMASLDAIAPVKPARAAIVQDGLPLALRRILNGKSLDEVQWKKKAPGIAVYDIPLSNKADGHLMLLSIAPGKAVPEHGHGGEEMTLILRGSYTDKIGRFQAGDIADLDESVEHQPVADDDGVCICLVATDGPTRFKSVWARIAQPFVGI